jgi:hypothetical protein
VVGRVRGFHAEQPGHSSSPRTGSGSTTEPTRPAQEEERRLPRAWS